MLWAIVHRTFMLIHSWLESHLVSRWCCWLPSKRGSHRECVCALLQLQRKWLCVKNERKQQQPPIYDAVQGHFTFPSRLPVTPKNQTHGKKASIENRHHSLEVSSGIYTYIYIYICIRTGKKIGFDDHAPSMFFTYYKQKTGNKNKWRRRVHCGRASKRTSGLKVTWHNEWKLKWGAWFRNNITSGAGPTAFVPVSSSKKWKQIKSGMLWRRHSRSWVNVTHSSTAQTLIILST